MLIVYTDPHLGLQRAAHTTPDSKRRLQDAQFAAVEAIHRLKAELKQEGVANELFCVGDFFDTYSNPEELIQRAAPLLGEVDKCLSGNHDVVGRESKSGSLELLDSLLPRIGGCNLEVIDAPYGQPQSQSWFYQSHDVSVTFVPHVATAGLFDDSLGMAMEGLTKIKATLDVTAPYEEGGGWKGKHYLFLHCNFDNELAAEKEATLNLSREDAQILLDHGFDYIVLGHVHQPSEHLGGRVIVLGNTHPTGFGDLGDKRIMLINPDGTPTFQQIYSAEEHELTIDLDDYLSGQVTIGPAVRFAILTGDIGTARAVDLAKAVKQIWSETPNLMALRSVVTIQSTALVKATDTVSFSRLPEHIEKELADRPALLAIWKEVTENA